MTRKTVPVLLVGLACAGLALAGDIEWMKLDKAKALAGQTGMPILVYSTVDEEGGSC